MARASQSPTCNLDAQQLRSGRAEFYSLDQAAVHLKNVTYIRVSKYWPIMISSPAREMIVWRVR